MRENNQLAHRRHSVGVRIGTVQVGGGAPVVVQSMTNTDTADAIATVKQVQQLAQAGSELVRVTVNTEEAAAQVGRIRDMLDAVGCQVPLIGDFHYNGHLLLTKYPDCARALAKYRINPGNVGFGKKKDRQFATMIETAIQYDKPIRIGVNWGSLDQELVVKMMDDNARLAEPRDAAEVTREALVVSALQSAARAEEIGLPRDKIILSCKVSGVQDLIAVYSDLAARCYYALHLGLTEAGMASKRIVAPPPRSRCRSSRASATPSGFRSGVSEIRLVSRCCSSRASATPSGFRSRRSPAAIARARSSSRRRFCRPWACVRSRRWSPPARAAAAPPAPSSRSWPTASSPTSARRCRSGANSTTAWKT